MAINREKLQKKADKAAAELATKISKGTAYRFKCDSVIIDRHFRKITVQMNPVFSYIPFREEDCNRYYHDLEQIMGRRFRDCDFTIETMGQEISTLIPNFYRTEKQNQDLKRLSVEQGKRQPFIRNISKNTDYPNGLEGRNIALWHSHGWFYESTLDRWEWQRARVFLTVEDLWTMSFVVPYIAPMLENAGASVFFPRERDTQRHEIIVDGDGSSKGSDYTETGSWEDSPTKGFGWKVPFLFDGENPFLMGKSRQAKISENSSQSVSYIPEIPETDDYSVSVAYAVNSTNSGKALYTVFHSGGKTTFSVNQKIGGGTWIYLGTFRFEKGKNPEIGKVELSNESSVSGEILSADAVKFGGGMGKIVRGKNVFLEKLRTVREEKGFEMDSSLWLPFTSQRPNYQEGARYYLQYAGLPDSLTYCLNRSKEDSTLYKNRDGSFRKRKNGIDDYKDDYVSRGEWVNYLIGSPNALVNNTKTEGLKIPIDVSLAFHTDAGTTPDSSIIGSLAIYDTTRDSAYFPNGQSKWASRDLCDIVQTQVTNDLQKLYEPEWTRRGMWNKQYSEAYRPKVPTMLSELLSHQNFADMALATDPRFKFDVSRAFYKGILKFLATQNGTDFTVQPLPVSHFQMQMEGKNIRLSWQPVTDPLEPSAAAKSYRIYTRIENGGFDNGFVVHDTTFVLNSMKENAIYSFKVTAFNEGGESFPSEILSCAVSESNQKPVLIVNAFDRICAPETFDNGKDAGFRISEDEGVSYKNDIAFVGEQYDFDRNSPWKDDDASGFGSSHADQETFIKPGNSFDYPFVHGSAIRNNGGSFISMSDEAFIEMKWAQDDFSMLDIIFGEEKTTQRLYGNTKPNFTIFTPGMQNAITAYSKTNKAKLLISGAYIGTDLELCNDSMARKFAANILHYRLMTNHASKSGAVFTVNNMKSAFPNDYHFENGNNPRIYKVESPDAIEPVGQKAHVLFRYHGDNKSAAVSYNDKYQSIAIGFPFETIVSETERNRLMGQILNYFELKE